MACGFVRVGPKEMGVGGERRKIDGEGLGCRERDGREEKRGNKESGRGRRGVERERRKERGKGV